MRSVRTLLGAATPVHDEAIADLATRWRHARRASLRAVVPGTTSEDDELDLLARALERDTVDALRRVFDNSLALGRGFARFFDHELTLDELPDVLGSLDVACLSGSFRPAEDEPALLLERPGCSTGGGALTCDFWREAIDGLVLGLTGGILHARHASAGHGDARCVDAVYLDPEGAYRFGPIPDEVRDALARVTRLARAFESSADVEWLGLSEGTLFYRVKQPARAGSVSLGSLVEREIRRRLPHLVAREASPRSVFAEEATTASTHAVVTPQGVA